MPSDQRSLKDDVGKGHAEKDYERLRQKIAREQAQERYSKRTVDIVVLFHPCYTRGAITKLGRIDDTKPLLQRIGVAFFAFAATTNVWVRGQLASYR